MGMAREDQYREMKKFYLIFNVSFNNLREFQDNYWNKIPYQNLKISIL